MLRKKIKKPVRGNNKEANFFILLSVLFTATAIVFSILENPPLTFELIENNIAFIVAGFLLVINLIISAASLIHLKDSWRVGILEDQKTELVTNGIYSFSRNPYFTSYLIMFVAYIVLLQNAILFGLGIIGFIIMHFMILKEEKYLFSVHGENYVAYKSKVARYLIL